MGWFDWLHCQITRQIFNFMACYNNKKAMNDLLAETKKIVNKLEAHELLDSKYPGQ